MSNSSNVPAHKQTNRNMKPGQVVNDLELRAMCYYSGQMTEQQLAQDITLSDYIRRKQRTEALEAVAAEKKLTFDEWYVLHFGNKTLIHYDTFSWVWDAAQENAPSSRPGAKE